MNGNNSYIKDKKELSEYINEKLEVFLFDKIDSTNEEAKKQIANGLNKNALFISKMQTNGKGRRGRNFYSPENGIYMTLSVNANSNIGDAVYITTAVSCAVAKAIEDLTKYNPQIKWVNDIIINSKKVCGILAEAVTDTVTQKLKHIVIGIGINTNTNQFPEDLKNIAGSINLKNISKNRFIAEIVNNIFKYIKTDNKSMYIDYYRKHSLVIGKEINYYENNIQHSALAIDIDENGGLIILENGKNKTLSSGEITLRIK